MWVVRCLFLIVAVAHAREFSDVEYYRLPQLFEMDDYRKCLSESDGLYCMGEFQLNPAPGTSVNKDYYRLIEEYSLNTDHFDRRRLYRTWCVSSRCGPATGNSSEHFERCVDQWARGQGLTAQLQVENHLCKTYQDAHKQEPLIGDTLSWVFVFILGFIVFMNAVGTLYDELVDNKEKNKFLTSWSLRLSWRDLVTQFDEKNAELAAFLPLQGIRSICLLVVYFNHVEAAVSSGYMLEPRDMERKLADVSTTPQKHSMVGIQVFFLISCFLFTHQALKSKKPLTLLSMPKRIIKRVIRMMPLYFLGWLFAVTLQPRMSNLPQWTLFAEDMKATCLRKSWVYFSFLNNIIGPRYMCVNQTWVLSVDMQMCVLMCILLVLLARCQRPGAVLFPLFLASCLANVFIAYFFQLQPMLFSINPNLIRIWTTMDNMIYMQISTWGNLPSCFLGMLMAYKHIEIKEQGITDSMRKWLTYATHLCLPIALAWIMSGHILKEHPTPVMMATIIGVERFIIPFCTAIALFSSFYGIKNVLTYIASWRGWYWLSKLSLPILMVQWTLCLFYVFSKPSPLYFDAVDTVNDFFAITGQTLVLAIPLAVLVEIPAQKFLTRLLGL